MTNDNQDVKLADFLSDLSVAVVLALQTHDEAAIEELSDELAEFETETASENEPELAAYFRVLRGLLQGDDVSQAAEELVEPYRAGYERVLQEIEEAPAEMTVSEWLARVTSIVATTVKRGSDEDRAELEGELAGLARKIGSEETEFHRFMAALRGVLRGEDTRKLALRLQPPYREAYQSLLQLLAADDTTDFAVRAILDRMQHNTVVALTRGDRKLRLAVAEALADIEEKLPEDEATTPHFRLLIVGALALLLEREPPASIDNLPVPFAEVWDNILAASRK